MARRTFYNQMATTTTIPEDMQDPAQIIAAAEKGEAWAQNWVGVRCLHGDDVPKDPVKAVEWIRKAAVQGDRDAQCNLGECYRAEEDFYNAAYWYRRSAAQGNGIAQNNLAVLYENGNGVPASDAEAYKWYNLAAAEGTAPDPVIQNATKARQEIVKKMTRAEIAEGQRRAAEFVPKQEHVNQTEQSTSLDNLILRCGGDFTRLIERLEAFEDRLKVRLEALKVDVGESTDGNDSVWVSGELHPHDGAEIGENIQLIVDILDDKGRVVNRESYVFIREKFFGFESFLVTIIASPDEISKIRVYPKKC